MEIFLPFGAYIVKPKWQAIGKDFCQILGQLPGTYVIMLTKKAASAKMAICCLTKTYPRPHEESNLDLAFRNK